MKRTDLEARDLGDVQREGRLRVGRRGEEGRRRRRRRRRSLLALLLLLLLLLLLHRRVVLVQRPVGPQAVLEEQGLHVRHELPAARFRDALERDARGEELCVCGGGM